MNFKIQIFAAVLMLSVTQAQLSPQVERDFMEFSDGTAVPITWSFAGIISRVQALFSGADLETETQKAEHDLLDLPPLDLELPKLSKVELPLNNLKLPHLVETEKVETPELRLLQKENEETTKPYKLKLKSKPMKIPEDEDEL